MLAQPKDLPALDRLLNLPLLAPLSQAHGRSLLTQEARALLDELRAQTLQGGLPKAALEEGALCEALRQRVEAKLAPRMKAVINLTGTVLHTNLGRALLADEALQHVLAMMAGPNNLEFDLSSGGRGDRDSMVEDLLCEITGAEAATVVNNNAAAVLLSIAALGGGKEVIVSRGELVEIGGAFRMPDVMAAAGARLVEVGTTNRTHPADYERAIGPSTALLMKVHTSNYRVQGFTSAVDEATLAPIAHAKGLPLVTDLGSGSLVDLAQWGLPREPLPQEMLAAGCDVVTFSGDKLLGGPAGRPDRRQQGHDSAHTQIPDEAGPARVKAAACRFGSHAAALSAARAPHKGSAHAAHADPPPGRDPSPGCPLTSAAGSGSEPALYGGSERDAGSDRLGLLAGGVLALGGSGDRPCGHGQEGPGHGLGCLGQRLA